MTDVTMPIPASVTMAAVLAEGVDGTLVTKHEASTRLANDAIAQLRAVPFANMSGRPPHGVCMLVEPLATHRPMGAFNAAIIVLADMTIVDERAVPPDVAPTVIDRRRQRGPRPRFDARGCPAAPAGLGGPVAAATSRIRRPTRASSNEDDGFAKAVGEIILPRAVAAPAAALAR